MRISSETSSSAAPRARGAAPDRRGCRRSAVPTAACRSPRGPASARPAPRPGDRSHPTCAAASRGRPQAPPAAGCARRAAPRAGNRHRRHARLTCWSMNCDALHSRSRSRPCSMARPSSASQSTSPGTRLSELATVGRHRHGRGTSRAASMAIARAFLPGSRGPRAPLPPRPAERPPATGSGVERAGGIVQQHVVSAHLGEAPRLVEHAVEIRHLPREREPGIQPSARLADGGGRGLQVLHVVERIVQPEDVDTALGRTQDEPPGEVVGNGPEPTRNRPRSAICSGVCTHRALSARTRSQGLSERDLTAASKQPPPVTRAPRTRRCPESQPRRAPPRSRWFRPGAAAT